MKTLGILTLMLSLATASLSATGEAALHEHWKRPVDTGNTVSGPYPDSCARCHQGQYEDWKGSLHSKSVGPGLVGQLDIDIDPQTAISCYYCHAPVVAQSEVITKDDASGGKTYLPNGFFDEKLKSSGVSCAVCHLRQGRVFGPPSPNQADFKNGVKADHAYVQEGFFEKAEFCAACHQLDEGFELNGKLLVNTYNEWKDSWYGKNNVVCQTCHMPGRRHLFRGIHDIEMVKSGVSFEVERPAGQARASAKLRITNSGTGHYFPTYVTPLVVVKGFLTDAKRNVLKGTMKEALIGRKATLDLSKELFDTRIAPFKSFEFDYTVKRAPKARRLVFEVWVFPDEFYNRFFENALKDNDPTMKKQKLKEAFKNTSGSGYLLFKREIPL
ncbi:MAG: hypothetical protein HY886_10610 [Deltaproteobacteria bacterium]|nr:hypothetical protein [Deltaproteobacteria bacterium]